MENGTRECTSSGVGDEIGTRECTSSVDAVEISTRECTTLAAPVEGVVSTVDSAQLPSEFFKKSHHLVFSQMTLSPVEHDIFALFLTRLAKEHWVGHIAPRYEFTSDVLEEWLGTDKAHLHSSLTDPTNRLASRKVGIINSGEQSFFFAPLFKRLQYKNGVLTIVPNEELRNEYLCLSQGHSRVPHKEFRMLKTENAKRLLTMLCRFRDSGELHKQTIGDLHGFFGFLDEKGKLTKSTMASNSVFLTRVVQKSIAEIKSVLGDEVTFQIGEQSGQLGYETYKSGRSIVAIKFLYKWKRKNAVRGTPLEQAVHTHMLIECGEVEGFSINQLENLASFWGQLVLDGFKLDDEFTLRYRGIMASLKQQEGNPDTV